MRYRRLGRTNLKVSELALGTVELGVAYGIPQPGEVGPPTEAEAAHILNHAVDQGINFIDTARAYGVAEEVIGRALKTRRDEIVLATKFRLADANNTLLSGDALRAHFWDSLEASLRALQTDRIDVYKVHAGSDPTILDDGVIVDLLAQARQSGKIRFSGLSAYGTDLPLAGLATNGFDTLQVAYNALDQRMEAEVFPQALARDVGVVTRSALLKGALTERAEHLPLHLSPLIDTSRAFRRLTADLPGHPTAVQAAVRFCLAHPAVSSVLVGIRSLAELDEALGISAVNDFDPATVSQLRALAIDDEQLLNPGTWGIP